MRALLAGTGLAKRGDPAGVVGDRRRHRRAGGAAAGSRGRDCRRVPRRRPLPSGRRSQLHAGRRRHGGHRHGLRGPGLDRRPPAAVAVGTSRRACAAFMPRTGRPNAAVPGSVAPSTSPVRRSTRTSVQRGDWLLDPAAHAPTDRFDARLAPAVGGDTPAPPLDAGASASRRRPCAGPRRAARRGGACPRPNGAGADRDRSPDRRAARRPAASCATSRRSAPSAAACVLDPWPPARGRRRPQRLATLRALERPSAAAALRDLIDGEPGWVDLSRFAQMWNLTASEAAETWHQGRPDHRGGNGPAVRILAVQRCDSVCRAVVETLGDHHAKSPGQRRARGGTAPAGDVDTHAAARVLRRPRRSCCATRPSRRMDRGCACPGMA